MVEKIPGLETGLAQSSAKSYVPKYIIKWDLRSLQDAFYRALVESPIALCLFIDGLDEYGGQTYELVRFFFSISERCGPQARYKVCLASRSEGALALGLEACPRFRMQDYNTQGIEGYVRNMLDSRVLPDEQDRRVFSKLVARKAEGIFLWARFAVSEVICSVSRGESLDYLSHRLDEVPLEMNAIYSKIFGRMSTGDQHDARLMFQLVCFATKTLNGLTLLQLKEAVDVANNRTVDPAQDRGSCELHRFRRTLRAKSGGLLEEVSSKASVTSSGSKDGIERDRDDPGGFSIRLIHRTVKSYLDQKGWLLELQIDNESFSPHALWLKICCKHVQTILGPSTSRSQYTDPRPANPHYILKPSVRHSLIQYASYSLFYHARSLEVLNGESSYKYLSLVSTSLWIYLRDKCRPLDIYDEIMVDWDAIDRKPNVQPWQIVVEQGLALCSGDVIKRGLYAPQGDDEAITTALAFHEYTADQPLDTSKDSLSQLVTLLLDSGAVVSSTSIIMCLRNGTVRTLEVLLDYWFKGSIEADAACRFSLLLELVVNREKEGFESMLDLLLAREKDILQVYAPDGNVLHDIIAWMAEPWNFWYKLERINHLVERGADIKVCSLQLDFCL